MSTPLLGRRTRLFLAPGLALSRAAPPGQVKKGGSGGKGKGKGLDLVPGGGGVGHVTVVDEGLLWEATLGELVLGG
jgi:hypothetical protein